MNPFRVGGLATIVPAFLIAGCDSSSSSGSSGVEPGLAAFNAVADLPQVTFLREEEVWNDLSYGTATSFRAVDADQYDVNFDALLPGDDTTSCLGDVDLDDFKDDNECTRLETQSINVIGDHEYVVALTGRYGSTQVRVYDKLAHEFDDTEDDGDPVDENAEIDIFHWSEDLGEMDVYVEPPGTNLTAVQVRATLASGDEFDGLVDAGDYVLSLTAIADPSDPIYTSETFSISARTRVAFAILDGTLDTTSDVRVSRFRDQGGDLLDRRTETALRVVHASAGAGNVDIYADQNYDEPLVTDFSIGQSTPYALVASTAISGYELDVTPAGNVGALLTREQFSMSAGSRNTLYLVDSANGTLDGLHVLDRFRRLAPYAELRLVNSAGKSIDAYVIPHGNNVYTSNVTETLSTGSNGGVRQLDPGSYDVWLAEAGTDLYLTGPVDVELAGNGIYTIVAIATTDATRADLVLLDDFAD